MDGSCTDSAENQNDKGADKIRAFENEFCRFGLGARPTLEVTDPIIKTRIRDEETRQRVTLGLIPSENIASSAVFEAVGSILMSKYAEGLPDARYYPGCGVVDQVENTAIERAKSAFGVKFANVQPHAGAQANMAAYAGIIKYRKLGKEPLKNFRVLGLDLKNGGHLTHGAKVNFSGSWFASFTYEVDPETQRFNFDRIAAQALEVKPHVIVAGATAYPCVIDFGKFREIADSAGALLMVDMAHIAGLIAGGAHPSPVPYADIITSTTHKTLRGTRGGMVLVPSNEELAAAVNKAVFPFLQGGPLMHEIAGKAVALREASEPEFAAYAQAIVQNSRVLAESLLGHGFRLVAGGSENHLMLIDLRETEMTGKQAQDALQEAGIIANMNTVPGDPRKADETSGVRLGTPLVTTRGMGPDEMKSIAGFIKEVLANPIEQTIRRVRADVGEFASSFPLFHPEWIGLPVE